MIRLEENGIFTDEITLKSCKAHTKEVGPM
jgi:hypothetical protein